MTDSNEFAHGHAGPNGPSVRLTFYGTRRTRSRGKPSRPLFWPRVAASCATPVGVRSRGMFCGMGICFDCLVPVDGRPNVRACQLRR